MKSTFLLDSILLAVARSRSAVQYQSIDAVINNLCREFLEMRALKLELEYDEKLGIKTLPKRSNSSPVTSESIRLIIDLIDELDALRASFIPRDEPIELTIDDEMIDAIQREMPGTGESIDAMISRAAGATLPLDEEIEAYETLKSGSGHA